MLRVRRAPKSEFLRRWWPLLLAFWGLVVFGPWWTRTEARAGLWLILAGGLLAAMTMLTLNSESYLSEGAEANLPLRRLLDVTRPWRRRLSDDEWIRRETRLNRTFLRFALLPASAVLIVTGVVALARAL